MPFLFLIFLCYWPQSTPFWLINQNGETVHDTIMLTSQAKRWLINKQHPVVQQTLLAAKPVQLSSENRYSLCFDSLELLKNPDGVYEIYVSLSPVSASALQPDSPYFAGVLDTYILTNTPATTRSCLDLPPTNQVLSAGPVSRCFVSVLFRGNKLPDGRFSQDAGSLSGSRIQLFAIK